MILLHEVKFLVGIIIIGIVITVTGNGVAGGGVFNKPDDCASNPMLPVCAKFCEELYFKEGAVIHMKNILCRNNYTDESYIVEYPYWKGENK